MRAVQLLATVAGALLTATVVLAADSPPPIDFARDIRPLFHTHCIHCHGGVRREGGLSLLAGGNALAGDSGKQFVIAGKPAESELIRRVTAATDDDRMPAAGPPLTADQVQKLRLWIEEGANWPRHWSFASVSTSDLPTVRGIAWPRVSIDAFVLAELKAAAAAPSREADRFTLIRRLSLDLLGLPPTPAAADAFAADTSPDAYERLVDRLLANPHFGERWGRHWLDLARYADSDGYEVDKPRPDAYRWRDWVIAAVNRDMPLDQFTVEQFAGDLLPASTSDQRLATAYHRQTLTNNEGGIDKEEYRLKAVLDRVSNMGTVWLGLTFGCAQCHDHPYDPFTQREYYELAAIFNNAEEDEIELPSSADPNSPPRKFRVLTERQSPRATRILKRGEFLQPGDEVQPGIWRGLYTAQGDGPMKPVNRLTLGRWLVDPANPLTTRVAANQIWLRLFGQGLVRTPEDFGARGQQPTHPELLDWLARELAALSWSRKGLIRRITASGTYRQSSRHRSDLTAIDPLNRLLGRQNRFRVEAEIVRDLHLAAGGLHSERIGGPSVFPPLGEEFVKITFRSELPWKNSQGADRHRRGMYTFFKRTVPYPDLMIFDCPDASAAAMQREASNTPLQALTTLNGQTYLEAARGLTERMMREPPRGVNEQIHDAFRICLVRPPTGSELARLLKLHAEHRAWYLSHSDDARAMAGDLPQVASEVARAAAFVATANVLLNVDEFVTRD
jgi:hypothetical protein